MGIRLDGAPVDPLGDGVGGQFWSQLVVEAKRHGRIGSVHGRLVQAPADPPPRRPRPEERPHPRLGANLVDRGHDQLGAFVEPGDRGVGILGRLAVVHVRGSSDSSRRSAMICAHHRFPRPTCLNIWLSVHPGQVGTGVVGSAW